ncbi:MAG: hypothetical protein KAJ57_01760 [Woeseiaceae bacterium]|nr:hypothetical protein [Woeseiaceae bacterium]
MIGEIKNDILSDDVEGTVDDVEDENENEGLEDTERVPTILEDDNVGDISVEINVEELVAKLEATGDDDGPEKREIRHRLDELEERRKSDEDLGSTYNFNLDDDL